MNGYPIHGVFSDIASEISFDNRRDFFLLLDEALDYQVERIIITFKGRLNRGGFGFFPHLFQKYETEITDCFPEYRKHNRISIVFRHLSKS